MTATNDQLEAGLDTLLNEVQFRRIVISGLVDPTAGAGVVAPRGVDYDRKDGSGNVIASWRKTGSANTAWTSIPLGSSGGGGGGGGIEGDWDVTPTTTFAVGQVEALGGTYTSGTGTFASNLAGESSYLIMGYPTKAAVLKTNVNINDLVVGTTRRFGFRVSQVPAAGQVLIMGVAPSAMTAAQFKTAMSDLLVGTPPASPFLMAEIVNFGGITAQTRAVLTNDSTTLTAESALTGATTAPMPAGIALNDSLHFLIGRRNDVGLGQDVLTLSSILIRDSDNAYNLGGGEIVAENPVLPTGLRVFFGLMSIDLGGGFTDIELQHDFFTAPAGTDVTGTTYENTGTQADFTLAFPAPVAGLPVYDEQPFPVGAAVNKMYRTQNTGALPAAPYGIAVSDEQIVVVDNVTPASEAFSVLADAELAATIAQNYDAVLTTQIAEASRRAGEMLFYVADPAYVGAAQITGVATYATFDAAYEAAILYPKFVAKIIVIDDRAGITINEPAGGKTYMLAENNIWVAGYSRWSQDSEEAGYGSTMNWAARVDALLLDHAGVNVLSSSETAGNIVDLSAAPPAPWGTTYAINGTASFVLITDGNAVGTASGGNIVLGKDSAFSLSGWAPAAMISVQIGDNGTISCAPTGGTPVVTVITPRTYENLSVNANVVVNYDNDDGMQDLVAGFAAMIPYSAPFVVYCGYASGAYSTGYWTSNGVPAGRVFGAADFAAAVTAASALATASPSPVYFLIAGEVRETVSVPVDLDGLVLSGLHIKYAVPGQQGYWRFYNDGTPASTTGTIFENFIFESLSALGGSGSAAEAFSGSPTFLNCRLSAASNDGNLAALLGTVKMADVNIESPSQSWFKADGLTYVHFSGMRHNPIGVADTWLYGSGGTIYVTSPTAPASRVGSSTYYGIAPFTYVFIEPVVMAGVATPDGRTVEEALVPTSWTAATLAGSWASEGGGYQAVQYRKTGYDLVQLRGSMTSGTATTLLTLPAGHRPPSKLRFIVDILDGSNAPETGDITIDTDGTVALLNPGTVSNHKVSFGTLTFSTT